MIYLLKFIDTLLAYVERKKIGVEKKLDCSKNYDFEPKMIWKTRADDLCSGLVRKSLRSS